MGLEAALARRVLEGESTEKFCLAGYLMPWPWVFMSFLERMGMLGPQLVMRGMISREVRRRRFDLIMRRMGCRLLVADGLSEESAVSGGGVGICSKRLKFF